MPREASVPGLTRRGHRAKYDRVLPKVGRVAKALGCDYDDPEAVRRAQALNTLADRGDYGVIARWRDEGTPDITEIVRAVREGDHRSLGRQSGRSLGRAVDEFMERVENSRSPATATQYDSILKQVVEHFGRGRPIASITSEEAERFIHGNENWKAASTQRDVKVLCGSVWALALDREREAARQMGVAPAFTFNPWRGRSVQVRPKTPARPSYLLPEEWRALITHDAVRGTPTAALLALGTLAGLRRAEICHLRTGFDVDMDARLVRIQPREGQYEWAPKGYSKGVTNSVRDVPMTDTLHAILTEHIRRGYAGDRFFIHSSWHDRPLSPQTAQEWTKQAMEAVGLVYGRDDEDGLTLHSLRHTFCTWLVSDGIPIPTVAKLAGNTPEVLVSTYSHHMPKDTERALEALEERGQREAGKGAGK